MWHARQEGLITRRYTSVGPPQLGGTASLFCTGLARSAGVADCALYQTWISFASATDGLVERMPRLSFLNSASWLVRPMVALYWKELRSKGRNLAPTSAEPVNLSRPWQMMQRLGTFLGPFPSRTAAPARLS